MKWLFGDSHVELIRKALGDEAPPDWGFVGVGGATARGVMNDDSHTRARRSFLEGWSSGDSAVIMLGECDVVDLLRHDPKTIEVGLSRLKRFIDQLSVDATTVLCCTVVPHTSLFSLYDVPAHELRASLETWNAGLLDPIDIYKALQGPDGYLPRELCHSLDDPGERHLNKDGYLSVWTRIRDALDQDLLGGPHIRCGTSSRHGPVGPRP